jgi:hypothetical protein
MSSFSILLQDNTSMTLSHVSTGSLMCFMLGRHAHACASALPVRRTLLRVRIMRATMHGVQVLSNSLSLHALLPERAMGGFVAAQEAPATAAALVHSSGHFPHCLRR